MRHRRAGRKLGRTSSHRKALLRNLVTEFLDKERVITTVPKAKELRPFAEKIITLGKRETLHARRQALGIVRRRSVVQKVFETIAPRFADRNGGYTRIIRLGNRKGDAAEIAIIELLGSEYTPKAKGKSEKKGKAKGEQKAKSSKAEQKGKGVKAERSKGEQKGKGTQAEQKGKGTKAAKKPTKKERKAAS
jgi:large subunit ribosomal protein L17